MVRSQRVASCHGSPRPTGGARDAVWERVSPRCSLRCSSAQAGGHGPRAPPRKQPGDRTPFKKWLSELFRRRVPQVVQSPAAGDQSRDRTSDAEDDAIESCGRLTEGRCAEVSHRGSASASEQECGYEVGKQAPNWEASPQTEKNHGGTHEEAQGCHDSNDRPLRDQLWRVGLKLQEERSRHTQGHPDSQCEVHHSCTPCFGTRRLRRSAVGLWPSSGIVTANSRITHSSGGHRRLNASGPHRHHRVQPKRCRPPSLLRRACRQGTIARRGRLQPGQP